MIDFDELFALEIARRAVERLACISELIALRWSSPYVESMNDVGAFVVFGEPWTSDGKLVTADWTVDGSKQSLDFLLWLAPVRRPCMEIVNYRESWTVVPQRFEMTDALVADRPA